MKRLYIILVLFLTITQGLYAQYSIVNDYDDPVIAQFKDTTTTEYGNSAVASNASAAPTVSSKGSFRDNWTLGLKGGITYFHLKDEQTSPKELGGKSYGFVSDLAHEFSIFTEYLFDNGLGLGAYVGNYSYNRAVVYGSSIEFGIYAHLNLLENAAWTQAPAIARRFRIYWDTGLGVSAMWQLNQIFGDGSSDKTYWSAAAVVKTGLQFEFMIRRNWGLFVEAEYHGYARGNQERDNVIYAAPWIHAGALSGGIRCYFDTRPPVKDPRLDENDLPIREPHQPKEVHHAPKNAFYINVSLTPEMIEEARENNGVISTQASEMGSVRPGVQVVPMKQSQEVASALKVLEEQGVGTVLINSVRFANEQLTDESMLILDKVAGSLMTNRLWQKVDLLYMCDKQANMRAAVIAAYLRAKGIKNLTVKGFDTKSNDATSDLIITIK